MTMNELEHALDLQRRTYALLLWLGQQARTQPHLLNESELSAPALCQAWLSRKMNVFPVELRPHTGELEGFALMLTSFFNTSFRIEERAGGVERRLLAGRQFKKHSNSRAQLAARELSRLALEEIARTENLPITGAELDEVWSEPALAASMKLWTYGCELVRRSQFTSQGPAVHLLWLEMDEETRRKLTAEIIWKARAELVAALKQKRILT